MVDKLNLLQRTNAECYAAGVADSHRFMNLYRAYLRGAYDAAGCREEAVHNDSVKIAAAAMTFAFLSWLAMLFFVFK